VFFPGARLPLRIFEQRYLTMVSDCLRRKQPVGVVLITQGREVGTATQTCAVGTLGEIVNWDQLPDGLLGIELEGRQRFRIHGSQVQADQLLTGDIEALAEPAAQPVPPACQPLIGLLREVERQIDPTNRFAASDYEDACWVSNQLADYLPLPLTFKQTLLEMDDAPARLERIQDYLQKA
jgi:Lon protease-like protein